MMSVKLNNKLAQENKSDTELYTLVNTAAPGQKIIVNSALLPIERLKQFYRDLPRMLKVGVKVYLQEFKLCLTWDILPNGEKHLVSQPYA